VLDWAYREFADYTVAKAGEPIDEAPVWLGVADKVPVAAQSDAVVTLWPAARKELKVTAVYDGTVKAPVAKGQVIGKLLVTAPDNDPVEVPLVAEQAVERLGPFGRVAEGAGYLLWGKKR